MAHFIVSLVATVYYNLGHFYSMAYVYKHIRKDTNEVFYIGMGITKKRYYQTDKRSNHWNKIVKKVGFYYEIIEDNLTWEEACKREKYWIKYYGRFDLNEGKLINRTNGGDGSSGYKLSKSHKEKISKANLGKPKSELTKQKLKIAHIGKVHSKYTKEKMSNTRLLIGNTNPGKRIIGDGVIYDTAVEAAKSLNIKPQSIFYRLNSPNWNWNYIDLEITN